MTSAFEFIRNAHRSLRATTRRWQHDRARRATVQNLERLHPLVLRDMGMSRGELMSVCFLDALDRRRTNG